jgi:hypothetical protein
MYLSLLACNLADSARRSRANTCCHIGLGIWSHNNTVEVEALDHIVLCQALANEFLTRCRSQSVTPLANIKSPTPKLHPDASNFIHSFSHPFMRSSIIHTFIHPDQALITFQTSIPTPFPSSHSFSFSSSLSFPLLPIPHNLIPSRHIRRRDSQSFMSPSLLRWHSLTLFQRHGLSFRSEPCRHTFRWMRDLVVM